MKDVGRSIFLSCTVMFFFAIVWIVRSAVRTGDCNSLMHACQHDPTCETITCSPWHPDTYDIVFGIFVATLSLTVGLVMWGYRLRCLPITTTDLGDNADTYLEATTSTDML